MGHGVGQLRQCWCAGDCCQGSFARGVGKATRVRGVRREDGGDGSRSLAVKKRKILEQTVGLKGSRIFFFQDDQALAH